ncbi:MAG: hypothetical protein CMM01_16680 [Rhodopirellula sp.]|nr:hypothetical protein [Rhodopirellula sp.]OUX50216.1 MAG: hypothetical protein CBE43_07705 [Rhodopirellula sp. TMED283]
MVQEHDPPVDPVYKSSLRELKWIFVIWLLHFVWVVGYCCAFGYPPPESELITVLGMPSWVFWGVFVPWISATLISTWFALTQIQDHELPDSLPAALATRSDTQTESGT